MKTRIVRIGNSRGVRIPKPLLEEAGLGDEVEIQARNGTIVIASATPPRADWREAAATARTRREDILLDPPTGTHFDDTEWTW